MSKQWPDKIVVGLTGNIATGKSAVMRLAAEKGALVLDADKIVHEIMDNDASMQAAIAVAFGSEVRRLDGKINRAALGAIVFKDATALRDLELMMHPAVRKEIQRRIEASQIETVFIEAIKLLEGELKGVCDQIWVMRCRPETQIQRLMVCRGMDMESAALRVNAQTSQEAKIAQANIVIDSDGPLTQTIAQFETAWSRLPGLVTPLPTLPPRPEPKPTLPPPPLPKAEPTPPLAPPLAETNPAGEIAIRRARPSDIPSILLLIQKATDGVVKMKRQELLMALSERSYLLGQIGSEVCMVVGWNTDSTTAARIDQIYAYPMSAVPLVGPALLVEIEKSAAQLICEVIFAFMPDTTPTAIKDVMLAAGFQMTEREGFYRAWKKAIDEAQPKGTYIMSKVLRDIRVA